jgi:hypothetical protein
VNDNCNANRKSYAHSATHSKHANDTAIGNLFTGREYVTVKEIEVFEIAGEMALRIDVENCRNGCVVRERARDASAGSAGWFQETHTGDSAWGKATSTRDGCLWRTNSCGRRDSNRDFGGECAAEKRTSG